MINVRRVALVSVSLLEMFIFGGIQFGWFALVFILKQEGVFKNFCVAQKLDNSTDEISQTDCFPQDEQFNLIFSVGIAIFTVVSVVNGQFYQSFNIKRIRMISISIGVAGLLFLSFTSTEHFTLTETPWLALPGIVLVGVAGQSLLISDYIQIPLSLQKGSSIYIGLLNGCFDSSVLTFLLVKKLFEDGIDKKFSFIGLSIVLIVISGVCTLLHPSRDQRGTTNENSPTTNDVISSMENNTGAMQTASDTTSDIRSVGDILRHHLFIGYVLWFTVVLLRYLYFLGAANRMMGKILQDQNRVSYFTDVMTFTMLGSMVSSFIAGYTIQTMEKPFKGSMKMVIPLVMTSCLAILLSAMAFVQAAAVLYVDFLILTFLRSFIYTVNMEFIRIVFPKTFASLIYGFVISFSGILTITQYGLFAWTEKYDTAMLHVNGFLLCLSTFSLFYPFIVFYNHRRKK